jgi:hypothetical protein
MNGCPSPRFRHSSITNYAGTIARLPLEDYLELHAWRP